MKFSVCIPYRARIDNLRIALEGLENQDLHRDDFEVCIGAMEYCPDFVTLCAEFEDALDIVSVLSSREFHIPRARNLAMRSAGGDVIVQMDADTLLHPRALSTLYDRHFSLGQQQCVVGQVVGYGNNQDGDVDQVEQRPYREHLRELQTMVSSESWPSDPRFGYDHNIPWAFVWTGLVALPRSAVVELDLYFDEDFQGWGVDDLEWGFRISASGLPINLQADVFALHLPHARDAAANERTELANYRRFIRKWPRRDVELSMTVGDVCANKIWFAYLAELKRASQAHTIAAARGKMGTRSALLLGIPVDEQELPTRLADRARIGSGDWQLWPLTGTALPLEDEEIDVCLLDSSIHRLSRKTRESVLNEAHRVAKTVQELAFLDDSAYL
ncbi:glycosyltransferase family A protein [Amycolatopsis sp. NPDC051102]|uniref:glycosyltransferase family 2 protein n=1 Tax=Amycolatopsis sp. NPDC051102 TaxID=3155163 RepID=UPI00341EFF6C